MAVESERVETSFSVKTGTISRFFKMKVHCIPMMGASRRSRLPSVSPRSWAGSTLCAQSDFLLSSVFGVPQKDPPILLETEDNGEERPTARPKVSIGALPFSQAAVRSGFPWTVRPAGRHILEQDDRWTTAWNVRSEVLY